MKYIIVGMLLTLFGAAVLAETVPAPANRVKRALICSEIVEHEPVDSLAIVSPTTGRIFFFTELVGMEGKTIIHRWTRDNARVAEVRIAVTGDRYRCHSSRSVAGRSGQWNVQVLDGDGMTLAERSFRVGSANGQTPLGQ